MKNENRFFAVWFCLAVIILFALLTIRCTSVPKVEQSIPINVESNITAKIPSETKVVSYPMLTWEKGHSERQGWTKSLIEEIKTNFTVLDTAKDINQFCPKYRVLSLEQKYQAWGEFFVALALYESSWDPTETDQDMGEEGDLDTYSDGLFQVSSVDRVNYKLQKVLPHYTHKELLTVEPNIKLAMALMSRQITLQKKICVSSDVYWSTLSCKWYHPYAVIDEISERVKKLHFCQ